MHDRSADEPLCLIDGSTATVEGLLPAATQNYGHITMLQMRGGMVRGLAHHLERLERSNQELFGRSLSPARVLDGLAAVAEARPDSTVRINIFEAGSRDHVMITATPPVEPEWHPLRFSLVAYERDMPHLKHVGSFGLILRQRQAIAAGYDGAVFLDRSGYVSEATIWNIGFFDDDEVVWPTAPALPGISQIIINEGLAALGVSVRREPIQADDLGRFRAAFLSNSATFGQPLSTIGSHSFEGGVDAVRLIKQAYELTPFRPVKHA